MCVFTSGINVPLVREIGKLIYLRKVGNFLLCIIYQFDYLDDSISLCKNTYWSVIKNPSAAQRATVRYYGRIDPNFLPLLLVDITCHENRK